ncbi:MAG: DUF4105 domain-containing protein [Polyangiaceae bacterium]
MTRVRLPAVCLALAAGAAISAPSIAHAEPGDQMTISVLTFGPGDHPFFKFGHNAIWVHDGAMRGSRGDAVYNYGTFAFGPLLIPEFLKGKLNYWLSVQSLDSTVRGYRAENRTIEAQELNLTREQKLELVRRLRENELPQNRYYKDDYYRDNCSTRVRDMVDGIVNGRLHDVSRDPASMSWRQHTLRLVADDIPIYLGLNIAMGDLIDSKVDVWGEMFLPAKLQETLRKATVLDADGNEVPLVKSEKLLLDAEREPVRKSPPSWLPHMIAAGSAVGAAFAYLGKSAASARWAQILFGLLLSFEGFLFGTLGSIFVMFWTLTDHQVAYKNENILQCGPWALALVYFGFKIARARLDVSERAFKIGASLAGASVLGLLLKALPWFDQQNGQIIGLILPIWLGTLAGLWMLRRTPATT